MNPNASNIVKKKNNTDENQDNAINSGSLSIKPNTNPLIEIIKKLKKINTLIFFNYFGKCKNQLC